MRKIRLFGAEGKRLRADIAFTAAFVALVVVFNVLLYSVCTIFSLYFFVDDDAGYQVGASTDAYLAAVNPEERDVTVWFCMPQEDIRRNRAYGRVLETMEEYTERFDYFHIQYNNVFLDYERTQAWAKKHDTEINEYSVIFECGENSHVATFTTFYVYQEEDNDARLEYNGAETVATVVNYVVNGEKDRPLALFTMGHAENSTTSIYNLMVSSGYTIGEISLSGEDIPENCSLVVISDPSYDFQDFNTASQSFISEIDKLEAFLERGGTLMVMRSPEVKNLPNLDRFLAAHGLLVNSDSVIRDFQNGVGTGGYLLLTDFATDGLRLAERVREFNTARIVTGKASPIRFEPVFGELGDMTALTAILQTSATAREYADGKEFGDGNYTVLAKSSTTYANGVTSDLILASTADIAAYEMMETDGYANEELLYALLESCDERTVPIGCPMLILNAYPVENLTIGEANLYFALLTFVLPGLVAAAGVWICLRRKNR